MAEALAIGVSIGIIPMSVGFAPHVVLAARFRNWPPFSAWVALGFLFLCFSDLILDSGDLGVSSGLLISTTQIALAALFLLGFLLFFLISERRELVLSTSFLAYLVAIAIGAHAFGEGMIIGNNLAAQIEIEDFSTILQGLSFATHKFLEGFTIALFLTPNIRLKNACICVAVAGVPLLAGIPLGILTYPAILANLLFALGAAAAIFIVLKVVQMIKRNESIEAVALGFLHTGERHYRLAQDIRGN